MEISKCYKLVFPSGQPVVKHLPRQQWTHLSLSQHPNRGARHYITKYFITLDKYGETAERRTHKKTTHTPGRECCENLMQKGTCHVGGNGGRPVCLAWPEHKSLKGRWKTVLRKTSRIQTVQLCEGGAFHKAAGPRQG